jgi:hypothetical protein
VAGIEFFVALRPLIAGGTFWMLAEPMARPMSMIRATMASMRSVLLSLAGVKLPAGPWATESWSKSPSFSRQR